MIVCKCLIVFAVLTEHYVVALNSEIICQLITTMFMATTANIEGLTTCILTHFAYIMYSNYCFHTGSTKRSEYLYKKYISYAVGTAVFFLIIMIIHDVINGTGKYTLQPDGHGILISNIGQ